MKRQADIALLLSAVIAAFTVYIVVLCVHAVIAGDCIFADDFRVFTKAAALLVQGQSAKIYNVANAQAWLTQSATQFHPYLYPPHSFLLLYALGLMSEQAAIAFTPLLFALMLTGALATHYMQQWRTAGDTFRYNLTQLFAALPFVYIATLAGQLGLFWLTLFILVIALRHSKPLLAGALLALFSLKPQLVIVLALLLMVEQNLRVILAAALVLAAWVGLSIALWGIEPWHVYFAQMHLFAQISAQAPEKFMVASASPYMALRMVGLNAQGASALQAVISISVLALLARRIRRGCGEQALLLLLPLTLFLVSPYGFAYDSILLLPCCLMLLARMREGNATLTEPICFVLLALVPLLGVAFQLKHLPYSFAAITLVFVAAMHLTKADRAAPACP